MGLMIGRKREQADLEEWCRSSKAELVCVYGRRRVGKTYLVEQTFEGRFAFAATGSDDRRDRVQLKAFHAALRRFGCPDRAMPSDWFDAFERLRALLCSPDVMRTDEGRRVVFLDEFPWFASKRSEFLAAFSDFWNSWASREQDLFVVICGSATSWIIKNILENTQGLYNRVTRQLYVAPFDLHDVELLVESLRLGWDRFKILQCYMIFGGLPYYISMLDRRKSLAQNVDALCLGEHAPLAREMPLLMEATLGDSPLHREILGVLAGFKAGLRRVDLVRMLGKGDGGSLKRALDDLEKCGYIRRYVNKYERRAPTVYQLIDPFLLFSFRFIGAQRRACWQEYEGTPSFYAWRGNAFEIVCCNHVQQIKRAIGVAAVRTEEFPWSSSGVEPSAQIDMVIERADGVTSLCEMKCTDDVFVADACFEEDLRARRAAFAKESGTRATLLWTLVCARGMRPNAHTWDIAGTVDLDGLFAF